MGLLDGLLGEVLGTGQSSQSQQAQNDPLASILAGLTGGNQGQSSNLLMTVLALIQRSGGLGKLLEAIRGNGLAAQADSWVGTGQNLNISPNQLQQILGASTMNDIATQFGVPQHQAGDMLAQLLPEIVNQMTPQGQVPDTDNELLAQALNKLARR